jgi:hypothetical protein
LQGKCLVISGVLRPFIRLTMLITKGVTVVNG